MAWSSRETRSCTSPAPTEARGAPRRSPHAANAARICRDRRGLASAAEPPSQQSGEPQETRKAHHVGDGREHDRRGGGRVSPPLGRRDRDDRARASHHQAGGSDSRQVSATSPSQGIDQTLAGRSATTRLLARIDNHKPTEPSPDFSRPGPVGARSGPSCPAARQCVRGRRQVRLRAPDGHLWTENPVPPHTLGPAVVRNPGYPPVEALHDYRLVQGRAGRGPARQPTRAGCDRTAHPEGANPGRQQEANCSERGLVQTDGGGSGRDPWGEA